MRRTSILGLLARRDRLWAVRSMAGVAFFDFGFDFEHLGMDVQKSARRNNL